MAHEPVTAGPPSQWYQLRKFARRNKGRVTAAAAAALLLFAGVVGTSLGMVEANRATERAVAEEEKAIAERDEKVKALAAVTLAREAEKEAKNCSNHDRPSFNGNKSDSPRYNGNKAGRNHGQF